MLRSGVESARPRRGEMERSGIGAEQEEADLRSLAEKVSPILFGYLLQ
jgi:hypothetical protein